MRAALVTRAASLAVIALAPVIVACGAQSPDVAPVPARQAIAPAVKLAPAVPALRPCAAEDSPGPCYWNAANRGNGRGYSFLVTAHGDVLDISPTMARNLDRQVSAGRGRSFVVTRGGHVFTAMVDRNGCLHYAAVTDCLATEKGANR